MAEKSSLWIGITSKSGDPEWVEKRSTNYVAALARRSVVGIILSPDAPAVLPDGTTYTPDQAGRLGNEILAQLDGLVLSGGGDVDPALFGAPMNGANPKAIHAGRDELELALTRAALARDMPTFGICRGCQVMNVAGGGGMVQHFEGHRSSKEQVTLHDVRLQRGTLIHTIVGADNIPVNTYHHQGVDLETLADGFVASGMADPDSWLVEALESPHHRWALGVQWHPERLHELAQPHHQLWDSFVSACHDYRALQPYSI